MKIAIILITFNQEKFILEALDGIRLQTRTPDEVVIADDGSKDRTQDLILAYVAQHNLERKWKIIFSENNKGLNENLQGGINVITSDVIIPLAGDDVSLPNRCAVAEQIFLSHPDVNHSVTAGYVIDETGELIKTINCQDKIYTDPFLAIKLGFPPAPPYGSAWRKVLFDVFGKLRFDIPNEDDQMGFRGMLLGGFLISSEKTYKYRVHEKSMSSWQRNMSSDELYFQQFKKNQKIRLANILWWKDSLEKIERKDKLYLLESLAFKADFYKFMGAIDDHSIFSRIIHLYRCRRVLCRRDLVYGLAGKIGILGWRRFRQMRGVK
ncbi:glycosyltransferase [Rhodoferax sp. PAMC 29310]|uniref:glycosyltransferase n=1 Tax=Rhodoferax sp. PAMC 29310 TaxID=2822760 RepID=UPI001B33D174|nr:glycosyltransferase [Rhodoferax sp. PAMC 29310]